MECDDLEPVKAVHIMGNYSDIEWLVPIDEDHTVKIPRKKDVNWAAIKRWCEQHCEDTVVIWSNSSPVHFCFFRQTDAIAFKLRWS